MYGLAIPVDEVDADNGSAATCGNCSGTPEDYLYFDGDAKYYCEACLDKHVESIKPVAIAYARDKCRITQPIPAYDDSQEYRCTPEEYEDGLRESYTPNAFQAHCRHCLTNYDTLIAGLRRDILGDQVLYDAIRDRIDNMLEEAIDALDMDEAIDSD